MSDSTLALEPIVAALQEFVQETLREQNAIFKERVDEMNLLKDELSQIVKESFILSADAQKSNETKIGKLLAQFEAAVTDTIEKIDKASHQAEERAEREGTYSELAQKNLDRAGKYSMGLFTFSAIIFSWTLIHFGNVRMESQNALRDARATLTQINKEIDAQQALYTKNTKTKVNRQEKTKP
jgi:hypothetical protein